jgi:hypothetical protein
VFPKAESSRAESERLMLMRRHAEAVARATRVSRPMDYFRYSIALCWYCESWILVFSWPGKQSLDGSNPQEGGRPRTLRMIRPEGGTLRYLANTCPVCSRVQGDSYLYTRSDGPFFGVRMGSDTAEAYIADMEAIAANAELSWIVGKGLDLTQRSAAMVEDRELQRTTTGHLTRPRPASLNQFNPVGLCVFCGLATRKWWWMDGKSRACKCKACQANGRS